jgi:hypothetical protein
MRGDMAPRNDRSIRNIPVSSAHRKRPARFEAPEYEEEDEPMPKIPRRRRKASRLFWISIVAVVVVFAVIGLLLSTLFSGASVVVYPRTATINPSTELSAQPNAPAGSLSYQVMTISVSGTTSVPASGTQKVSRQASGSITIYNSFSKDSQRLIANTRFEAPDGKIYRIHDSVVVPGMQGTTPGSASIMVYADSPGTEYNRGQTRFTIPGFKNDPRYTKFYADAASISGGFIGDEPAVASADLEAAKGAMATKLNDAAQKSLASQIPEGFILINNANQSTLSDLRQTPDGSGKASLSQTLTMSAALVRLSDLAAYVTSKSVENYGGEAVQFADPSAVSFAAAPNTKPIGKVSFTMSGATNVVWQYDDNAVKTAIAGKNKSQFESIIASFRPALTGAEVTLRPFWKSTFPSDLDKIKVVAGTKK